jgi:hypothetical protein
MTDDRLAELERLCAAATPGPWEVDADRRLALGVASVRCVHGTRPTVAHVDAHLREMDEAAAFVAAARTAVPELIAEVRRLRAEAADLKARLDRADDYRAEQNERGNP